MKLCYSGIVSKDMCRTRQGSWAGRVPQHNSWSQTWVLFLAEKERVPPSVEAKAATVLPVQWKDARDGWVDRMTECDGMVAVKVAVQGYKRKSDFLDPIAILILLLHPALPRGSC